jgi:hypothetical protein
MMRTSQRADGWAEGEGKGWAEGVRDGQRGFNPLPES